MFFYLNLITIVLAVSLDGFSVGITYGIRNIKITITALCIIMCCSGMIVLISMTLGHFIRMFLPVFITDKLGGIIFILLGAIVLGTHLKKKLNITLGVPNIFRSLTSILSQPLQVDKDKSGSISGREAFILGIALAMDAFGAGLAAAIIGYSPGTTALLIALMSGFFLYTGIKTGILLSKYKPLQNMTILPPLLLICIGIFKIL